ncbi:MAG: YwiC-like family protein [Deltaproteobacteria bacterium]|nr:YwiC-like family protein [Deltaproteobacteria bacterium]
MFVPKAHGAWAMLAVPLALGLGAGRPSWLHAPFLVGALLLYLGSAALVEFFAFREARAHPKRAEALRSAALYLMLAAPALALPLARRPLVALVGAAATPAFLVAAYFAARHRERTFWNGLASVAGFSVGGAASYVLGTGALDRVAASISLLCFAFFLGSLFFVRSALRERGNRLFHVVSWIYHAALPLALLLLGRPMVALAFVPSLLRALAGPAMHWRPLHMGLIEIGNSVYFTAVLLVFSPRIW